MTTMTIKRTLSLTAVILSCAALQLSAADKTIVLIAGKPSHPPGMHEFRAGCLLLKSCLDQVPGITSVVYSNGWPNDPNALAGADAVLIYADGGAGHPALQIDHREILGGLAKKGVGLGFAHYGVEVPSTNGGPEFLEWIGGYYEHLYSVNPMWSPDFQKFPSHPIARGVKAFSTHDEWYFNIRFRPEITDAMAPTPHPVSLSLQRGDGRGQGKFTFTPLLVATPSNEVRSGPYVYPRGPYDHIIAARGRAEIMMWAYERPDGGRSFGFTGGHTHAHWGDPNQRKIFLNALLWIAKADIPRNGVEGAVTPEQLKENLDPKGARK
jgi:hypothetical protein